MTASQIEEVTVDEAWKRLGADPASVLVDVRTRAEWSFVGMPDLASVGKRPVLMEWQSFPDSRVNPDFVAQLTEALRQAGAGPTTEVLFICRSGARSMSAAQAMAVAGFSKVRNVRDGFEGGLDPTRHRGTIGGWKARGLPWVQG